MWNIYQSTNKIYIREKSNVKIKINNMFISNTKEVAANSFNDYFASIGDLKDVDRGGRYLVSNRIENTLEV